MLEMRLEVKYVYGEAAELVACFSVSGLPLFWWGK